MKPKHMRDMQYEDMPIGMLVSLVSRAHFERIRNSLERYGVQKTYGPILRELSIAEGVSQTELAESMRVTSPSMSVNLQKMESAGFLIRKPDDADLRHIRLHLTEKGREAAVKADRELALAEHELMAPLTQEEQMELRRLLIKMLTCIAKGGLLEHETEN